MSKYRNIVLSLGGALLLSAGWLSLSGIPLLAALVPLLLISRRYDGSRSSFWKTAGWTALTFGLWSGATTWWIWYATPLGPILSVLITISLFGGIFMLYHFVSKRAPAPLSYTILVCGWIACEYLYTYGEVSFPWLMLGNGFANDVYAVQWYDTTGIFGGTLWVLLSNISLTEAWVRRSTPRRATAAVIISLPLCISAVKYISYREPQQRVSVTVVQPNFDPYTEKFYTSQQYQAGVLSELIAKSPVGTDIIVLPETSVDDTIVENYIDANPTLGLFRQLIAQEYPSSQLITGAVTYRRYGPGEKVSATARTQPQIDYWYDVYNSAVSIDSSGVNGVHHKSMLVVGVEKMPYTRLLKFLQNYIVDLGGITGQLGVDTERKVFTSPHGVRSAAAICYESVYGQYYSEFVRGGAQLMMIITNDGWWGDTPGYRQHFSFARLRAIETRRSIARSANTGISGFIDQKGRVISRTRYRERAVLHGEPSLNDHITFYTRYGDIIARIANYVFFLSLLYYIVYRFRKRHHLND